MGANLTSKPDLGLCVSCDHAPTCIYLSSTREPIAQCEEFSTWAAAPRPVALLARPEPAIAAVDVRPLGLCMNCDNLASCVLPKSEAGVWHCSEYR